MRSMPPVPAMHADDKPGSDDLLIRPATSSDVDDFYELARLAGAGFTSLPVQTRSCSVSVSQARNVLFPARSAFLLWPSKIDARKR